jgi:hypothetical protein
MSRSRPPENNGLYSHNWQARKGRSIDAVIKSEKGKVVPESMGTDQKISQDAARPWIAMLPPANRVSLIS